MSRVSADEVESFYTNDIKSESYNNCNSSRNSELREDRKYVEMVNLKEEQEPQSYAIAKPAHGGIVTSDNMAVSAIKTSAASANSRRLHFQCQVCGERVATRNSLSTHIKSHRKPYCRFCFVVLKTTRKLRMHLTRVHPPKSPHRDVTVVTSKYGRQRQVLSARCLMKRRKKDE